MTELEIKRSAYFGVLAISGVVSLTPNLLSTIEIFGLSNRRTKTGKGKNTKMSSIKISTLLRKPKNIFLLPPKLCRFC